MRGRLGFVPLAAFLCGGCSVGLGGLEGERIAKNECKARSDCGLGICQDGACVAAGDGKLSTLLFAVIPPATTPKVGGARFLQVEDNFAKSRKEVPFDVTPAVTVHGFMRASPASTDAACSGTVPAQVTFTPRQNSFGLRAETYVSTTRKVTALSSVCSSTPNVPTEELHEFVVDLPAGDYDVYVRPPPAAPSGTGSGPCDLVPRLFSGLTVKNVDTCFPVPSGAPKTLELKIPWTGAPGALDGWSAEVVHPLHGLPLSNPVLLSAVSGATAYEVAIPFSEASEFIQDGEAVQLRADDVVRSGQYLVRLSPKAGSTAPVVQFVKAALEATLVPETPALDAFPGPVTFDGRLWRADQPGGEVAVAGKVKFTATELDGIPTGVFAAFSTVVDVGEDGAVRADLLPGKYLVGIVPRVGLGLAATETTLAVACEKDPAVLERCLPGEPGAIPPTRAGWTAEIPTAATVKGAVYAPFGSKLVENVTVQALPASLDARRCSHEVDAGSCAEGPVGVLDESIGDDAFAPRSVTAIAPDGRFTLTDMDCGECTAENGAVFEISVRPADGSRMPWLVRPGVTVGESLDLGQIRLSFPIVHSGFVRVDKSNPEARIAGALIQAYVLRDQTGELILHDVETTPSCAEVVGQARAGSPCIRSVVQVAETRSLADGSFELILPSVLE